MTNRKNVKNIFLFVIILVITGCAARNTAKKQAHIMTDAIINNKYEITLKYTYPGVVKMIGGDKNFIEILKTGTDEMNKMGNKYESIELGKPTKTIEAGNEIHCLIPETIRMKLKVGSMSSKSYLLAASSDKGKNWTFVETALLSDDNIKTILPDYNKELVIPEKEVPQYFK